MNKFFNVKNRYFYLKDILKKPNLKKETKKTEVYIINVNKLKFSNLNYLVSFKLY